MSPSPQYDVQLSYPCVQGWTLNLGMWSEFYMYFLPLKHLLLNFANPLITEVIFPQDWQLLLLVIVAMVSAAPAIKVSKNISEENSKQHSNIL